MPRVIPLVVVVLESLAGCRGSSSSDSATTSGPSGTVDTGPVGVLSR
jgi:hypothetical protein